MKAILSTNYNDTYLYFLPIVTKLWNLLGVDVICFVPKLTSDYNDNKKIDLLLSTIRENNLKIKLHEFNAPKHKEATYTQCSRLYGACLDLPEDEILVLGDIDMLPFQELKRGIDQTVEKWGGLFNVYGVDLVPDGQIPMCYVWGCVNEWRKSYQFSYGNGYLDNAYKTYQEYLDLLLGGIDCENMRGNYWSKDQQELKNLLSRSAKIEHLRARPNTQFAKNRVDRDDINWRSYVDDSLIDAHLWRDGFTEQNHSNIMELLKMKYPNENFDWINQYREQYISLIKK